MNLAEPLMSKEQTTIGEPTLKNLRGSGQKRSSSENDNHKSNLDQNQKPAASRRITNTLAPSAGNVVIDFMAQHINILDTCSVLISS